MSFPPPPPRPAAGPDGQSAELIYVQKIWDIHWDPKTSIFVDTPALKFDKTPKGYVPVLRIPPANPGTKGWFWTKGEKNYDHTKSYKENQLVYVKPTDALITAGTTDPDSMATVKAIAGIWVALKDVTPKVISGVTYYYVPHLPMPTPGDMDAVNNYWAFVSQDVQCY